MFKRIALTASILFALSICLVSVSVAADSSCAGINEGSFAYQGTLNNNGNALNIGGAAHVYRLNGGWFISLDGVGYPITFNPYCLNMSFIDGKGNSYWAVIPTCETEGWTVMGGGASGSAGNGHWIMHEHIRIR